jgi:hypothetical protein
MDTWKGSSAVQRKKSVLLLAALAAGLLVAAAGLRPAPLAAAGNARVSGGGQYMGEFGQTVVSVNAIQRKDGAVSGQFEQHNAAVGLSVHGVVNCLHFLSNNTAVVGGILTNIQKNQDPQFSVIQAGLPFFLAVRDNGEGRKASPDQVSPFAAFGDLTRPLDCSSPEVINYFFIPQSLLTPIASGNFQVSP